ncbi:hypothetical protein Patl1_16631 [Pistacia atlantica]|uniref:Uncharacterized protein n=1 Tax=Pistacia atlantica TaxID=434234 RepID=A0ACC1B6Q3_9ROSI|nr:hypothetical protein Patl1_16631 [Pistacia atlantica]
MDNMAMWSAASYGFGGGVKVVVDGLVGALGLGLGLGLGFWYSGGLGYWCCMAMQDNEEAEEAIPDEFYWSVESNESDHEEDHESGQDG